MKARLAFLPFFALLAPLLAALSACYVYAAASSPPPAEETAADSPASREKGLAEGAFPAESDSGSSEKGFFRRVLEGAEAPPQKSQADAPAAPAAAASAALPSSQEFPFVYNPTLASGDGGLGSSAAAPASASGGDALGGIFSQGGLAAGALASALGGEFSFWNGALQDAARRAFLSSNSADTGGTSSTGSSWWPSASPGGGLGGGSIGGDASFFAGFHSPLAVDAFARLNVQFGDLMVLTDIDDTLWSSGSVAAFGKHIGGVDPELSRGQPYPGLGTLYCLLALGTHTSTPSGKRIPRTLCPAKVEDWSLNNCPVEVAAAESVTLPRRPGVLSARASTSPLASVTRPASFFRDVDAILTRGARAVFGPSVQRWSVGFQNEIQLLKHVLASQHARGAAKVWGFTEALKAGAPTVVFGDTGEKDPEAAAGMAVKRPEMLAAVLLHYVFANREKELEAASRSFEEEGVPYAIPFPLQVPGGKTVEAFQLVYDVSFPEGSSEQPRSLTELDDQVAYAIGVQIAHDVRRLLLSVLRRKMLLRSTKAESLSVTTDETHGSAAAAASSPIAFVKLRNVLPYRGASPVTPGTRPRLAGLGEKLVSSVGSWTLKSLSSERTGADLGAFRRQAEVIPVFLERPFSEREISSGVSSFGVPFAAYRTAVGAALASWELGMVTSQDLVSLVVSAVRDLRSLGPPTHCLQKPVVADLLSDVEAVETLAGPLAERSDLAQVSIYADAVASLKDFAAFHLRFCGAKRQVALLPPFAECYEALADAARPDASARGPPRQLLSILRFACRTKEQLRHWLSAGYEEVESLTFELGRALLLGFGFAEAHHEAPAFSSVGGGGSPGAVASLNLNSPSLQSSPLPAADAQSPAVAASVASLTDWQNQVRAGNAWTGVAAALKDSQQLPPALYSAAAPVVNGLAETAPAELWSAALIGALDVPPQIVHQQTLSRGAAAELAPWLQEQHPPFLATPRRPFGDAHSLSQIRRVQQRGSAAAAGGPSALRGVGAAAEEGAAPSESAVGEVATASLPGCRPTWRGAASWVSSMRSFCTDARRREQRLLVELCDSLREWLLHTHGALASLVKVADWEASAAHAASPLVLPELSLVVEPSLLRGGETGRQEAEKAAAALEVFGAFSQGSGSVGYRRPSERHVWSGVSAALRLLWSMECDPFSQPL